MLSACKRHPIILGLSVLLVLMVVWLVWPFLTQEKELDPQRPSATYLLEPEDYDRFRPGRQKIDVLEDVRWRGNLEMATRDGNQLEQIALKPKMTIEADNNADVSVKIKSQDAKGTAYFDNKAGRFVEMKMTQTMEMEVSAGGQTLSQKIEKTVSMKLNEKAK
jgi:hypothetical protein